MASTNTKDFLAKAFFVDGISNSIFFQRLSLLHFYIRILDRKKYTLLLICHVDGVDLFTFSTRFWHQTCVIQHRKLFEMPSDSFFFLWCKIKWNNFKNDRKKKRANKVILKKQNIGENYWIISTCVFSKHCLLSHVDIFQWFRHRSLFLFFVDEFDATNTFHYLVRIC